MKKIIDYFVDNSVVVNLVTLMIILSGGMALVSLNKEVFPAVDFDFINIRVAYQGAAAEDVEKMVTVEIERELKSVDGIEEINAMSAEGAAIITLKIDPDMNTDDILIDVRNELGDLASKVPEEVEAPVINKLSNTRRSLMTASIIGKDEKRLREDAKHIRDFFELDKNIAEVTLDGFRDEIFDVQVQSAKLEKYEVTFLQIYNAIKDRQVDITAGNLKGGDKDTLIRTLVENETVEDLESIVILSNDIGNTVRVKDVARVSRVLEDKTREDRAEGQFSISLGFKVKTKADVVETADFIKSNLETISEKRGFNYKIFNDLSYYVKKRLGILSQNASWGILLVTLCLCFFMSIRVSIITALGAPFAFLVAFALMDSFGITINLISMFALILVLGMLVDDSIIVAEQYFQYIEKGEKPKDAAKLAAYDTIAPISSTVLTTMIAFGSLFYMEGIMGKFLWSVPAVVILCLLASWVECFIILPGHLADWGGSHKNTEKSKWYKPLLNVYKKVINTSLKRPVLTVTVFVGVFVFSLFVATKMKFELFPADDVTVAYFNIKGPVGSSFEKTAKILKKLEKVVQAEMKEGEMLGYRSAAGYQFSKQGTPRLGSHYGMIFLELTMPEYRPRNTDVILNTLSEQMKKHVGDYSFALEKLKGGPPGGKPVNVEISGDSLDELKLAANEVKEKMTKMNGLLSVEVDFEIGKKQIIIDIDEVAARRLNVSNKQIALELRNAFEGLVATTIKDGDEDLDVLVRLDAEERKTTEVLEKIKILNAAGQRIPLMRMVKLTERDGAFVIRRFQRKRTISIAGEVDRIKTTSRRANAEIRPIVKEIVSKYPGMIFQLTGENKDTSDSLESFKKALVASSFLIFIILVVQFSSVAQPLIIMSAIPFGLIGVIFSFFIFGMPIGFMALMGMLGLVGVVINDSIVLVSFMNKHTKEFGTDISIVVEACMNRFRPVILTTFTTVIGLLPIAHMPGGDPFLKPMAISFAYGLLVSSAITLIFVPTCYFLYIKFIERKISREKSLV